MSDISVPNFISNVNYKGDYFLQPILVILNMKHINSDVLNNFTYTIPYFVAKEINLR
jgi:hypothetical protein